MEVAAFDVFANGIAGVFAGISVLYVAVRLNALAASKADQTDKKE
jgi:hypothetical protein